MTGPGEQDLREQAAAYALGGLSPEDARAFEAYLDGSAEARREVAEYREVNALLALGAAGPVRGLRDMIPADALPTHRAEAVDDGRDASLAPRRHGRIAAAGTVLFLGVSLGAGHVRLAAQLPPDLARDRAAYSRWLMTASLSPYSARALQPIGTGVSIGTEPADVPLAGVPHGTLTEERGAVVLVQGAARRTLPRNRPTDVGGGHQVVIAGPPGRAIVAAYGPIRDPKAPDYFDHQPDLAFTVELLPPERQGRFRILGPDGVEVEAAEAGLVAVLVGGDTLSLRVYLVGARDAEEAELLIFFRDGSNGHGSYPAGRFVELLPLSGGRYWLDFNRARSPFCAYNTVFPCPAPWPGNHLAATIAAGERYAGGGLELD